MPCREMLIARRVGGAARAVVLGGELRDWSSASLDLDQQMSELCNRSLRTHRFQERKLDLKSFRHLLSLLPLLFIFSYFLSPFMFVLFRAIALSFPAAKRLVQLLVQRERCTLEKSTLYIFIHHNW